MISNLHYFNIMNSVDWSDTLMFVDFDGSLIKSYDNSEIQGLSSLPSLPDHSGDRIPLTSQGWNWTLAEIKSYNLLYPNTPITVGPLYCPTDSKTYITTPPGEVTLYIIGEAEINWGDGTINTLSGTGSHTITHVCSDFCDIGVKAIRWNSSSNGIFVEPLYPITDIRCGKDLDSLYVGLSGDYAYNLKTVSTSKDLINILLDANEVINDDMKVIILPKHSSLFDTIVHFNNFKKLICVASSYAKTTPISTSPGSHYCTIYGCSKLCRFTTPDNIGMLRIEGNIVGIGAPTKNSLVISGGVTVLNGMRPKYTSGQNIIVGSNVALFMSDFHIYGNSTLTFKGTTPPTCTLSGGPLVGEPDVIYVPYSSDHTVLNRYKTTSPWSRYASLYQESSH